MYKYSACGFSVFYSTTRPYTVIRKRVYSSTVAFQPHQENTWTRKSAYRSVSFMTFQSKPWEVQVQM